MSEDARVRYSKMVIRESFIQLNAEKPLNQITVKEICDRAGVNRSTFYRNFIDIYDLKDSIEEEFLVKIKNLIHGKEVEGTGQISLNILHTMKENQNRYTSLHDIPSMGLLLKIIDECFLDKEKYIMSVMPHIKPEEVRWLFDYISFGCASVMIKWAKSGMKESPEEIAGFLVAMVRADFSALRLRK